VAIVATPTPLGVPPAGNAPARARNPWLLRTTVALLAGLYIFGSGVSALTGISLTDLDVFFVPSALYVLHGHPLQIYALRYQTTYPTANGPVSIMLLAAVVALVQHLGWLNDLSLRRMIVMAAFSIFPLLMSWEAVAAVDRLRGTPLRGIWRLLAYTLFATAPGVWHSMLLYGHIEEPIAIWLTLLSIRLLAEERPGWAGLSMGLALLTRTSILVPCVVLFLVLAGRRRVVPAAAFLLATALTVVVGIVPFVLADAHDVVYSLVTFRASLNIGGGSLWYLLIGTPLESVGMLYDSRVIVAAAALVTLLLLTVRRNVTVAHRDLYGVLVLAGVCFPLLIKTVWPYYFFDLYIFMCIWWLGDARGWRTLVRWLGVLLPACLLVCEGVADYGTTVQLDAAAMHTESLAITMMEVGFVLVFGAYLATSRDRAAPASVPAGMPSSPSVPVEPAAPGAHPATA
jgi:hypothetical protein